MSNISQHIDHKSLFLFGLPGRFNITKFLLRFLASWYIDKVDILRIELIELITLVEKNEVDFDYKSYKIMRRAFRYIYKFNELLSKDDTAALYKIKISINQLYEAISTLLIIYEKRHFSDDEYPLHLLQDNSDLDRKAEGKLTVA